MLFLKICAFVLIGFVVLIATIGFTPVILVGVVNGMQVSPILTILAVLTYVIVMVSFLIYIAVRLFQSIGGLFNARDD